MLCKKNLYCSELPRLTDMVLFNFVLFNDIDTHWMFYNIYFINSIVTDGISSVCFLCAQVTCTRELRKEKDFWKGSSKAFNHIRIPAVH